MASIRDQWSALSSGGTNDFAALLQNLHQSKISAEQDQKACEQNRQEANAVNRKIQELLNRRDSLQRKIIDAEVTRSKLASELAQAEIREKIVTEGMSGVERELEKSREALSEARIKMVSISRKFLIESEEFAVMYNGTGLGRENRIQASKEELEDLKVKKHQLQFELGKFLEMKKHVEDCEQENKELEEMYRAQDNKEVGREKEAFEQLSSLEGKLEKLQCQAATMDKELEEESKRVQSQLQNVKQSISFWERRVADCRQQMGQQKSLASIGAKVTVGTSPGVPHFGPSNTSSVSSTSTIRPPPIRPQFPTSSKQPRMSVKPTPQARPQGTSAGGAQKAQGIKYVQTTLPIPKPSFSVTQRTQGTKYIQTTLPMSKAATSSKQIRFIPPIRNDNLTSKASPVAMDKCESEFDDDSYSSSQYFSGEADANVTNSNTNSNTANTFTTATTSTTGRTFNFKKKPIEGPKIPGPSNSSVAVTLGKTPFSTFQSSTGYYQSGKGQHQ